MSVSPQKLQGLKISLLLLLNVLALSACATTTSSEIRSSIGDEYHVLKFPVMQHNIGSEWSKQFNATGKGALTEERILVEKSLKNLDRGTAKQIALGVAALDTSGRGGAAGIEAELLKQSTMRGLHLVKPSSLGYIAFKPGVNYVTESLRIEGFYLDSQNKLKFQVSASGSETPQRGAANVGFGTGSNSGIGGEGLVIGYLVQTVDTATVEKQESGPVALGLNSRKVPVGNDSITASVSYEKVVAGSGKSLPKNLLWACRRAASKKDTLNAAWVVTLAMSGEERKTLKIAFPAHPEIEECNEYEGVIASGINSVTDKIERTRTRISIDTAAVNELLEPTEFGATVSTTRDAFKVKTVYPET